MSTASPSLADLGWDPSFLPDVAPPHARPARVTLQGRDVWRVHDGVAEHSAGVRGRLRAEPGSLPVAGDWVLLGDDVIESVLPRRTALVRKQAGQRTVEQVLAANVDLVLVCAPAHSLNARRLERELTVVWESGATPYVVVTKSDLLLDDVAETLDEVRSIAIGVEVLAVSSYVGDGLDAVRDLLAPGITGAAIGPSGAGKSTLVNALVGHEVLATTAVRSDNRGVHTTTARHLVPVPGGGLVLDTPGMRELVVWADEEALDATFVDVDAIAAACRFSDCSHHTEPGCAVLAAVESGELDEARLESWRKLQRELAHLARKQDARLAAEERKRWAKLTREGRARSRH
ncbi:MAG: ribosome small subunit-dependent GTPase A [Candidatus Nanopelagicales bacterium]